MYELFLRAQGGTLPAWGSQVGSCPLGTAGPDLEAMFSFQPEADGQSQATLSFPH